MSAYIPQAGDRVRGPNYGRGQTATVVGVNGRWFWVEWEDGVHGSFGDATGWTKAPDPLPEPYIGYTHGGSDPDGVPTVYPLSIFHGSDTFYDSDLYEVEVRYIRKVDTRRPF